MNNLGHSLRDRAPLSLICGPFSKTWDFINELLDHPDVSSADLIKIADVRFQTLRLVRKHHRLIWPVMRAGHFPDPQVRPDFLDAKSGDAATVFGVLHSVRDLIDRLAARYGIGRDV